MTETDVCPLLPRPGTHEQDEEERRVKTMEGVRNVLSQNLLQMKLITAGTVILAMVVLTISLIFVFASHYMHIQCDGGVLKTPGRIQGTINASRDVVQLDSTTTIFIHADDIPDDPTHRACAVESYIVHHSDVHVVYVYVTSNHDRWNVTVWTQLTLTYPTLDVVVVDRDEFFKDTLVDGIGTNLSLLAAKVLLAWRYNVLILDPKYLTLKTFSRSRFTSNFNDLVIELDSASIIDTKLECHEFLFQVLKTLAEDRDWTEKEVLERSREKFCENKRRCHGLTLLQPSLYCRFETKNDMCHFLYSDRVLIDLCPVVWTWETFSGPGNLRPLR